ncbi:hypothetical protein BS47DRAFT_1398364 [Hydnum rufescens UP504]|uniref:Uncharacterized protein n=1 Tax=Hydnum rufescens UP504 TaxID=1448309 RepID=A0A9P6DMB3_9AGAM|nr:hypothetical protein BS47DRAFT_1398364 [Hydnum rufescens UP504]
MSEMGNQYVLSHSPIKNEDEGCSIDSTPIHRSHQFHISINGESYCAVGHYIVQFYQTGLPLIHTSGSTSQPPPTALITHRDVGVSQPHMISDVNLLGKLTQASLANYGWLNDNDPHDAFAGIDDGNNSSGSEFQESNLGFTDDEDSNNVSNEGSNDAGGSNGIAVDVSAIKEQLRNLQAQDTDIDPGLQDDTINHDKNLQDRPLSLDQKKVSQALWGQYMTAVNWLAKDWGVRCTRILIEGGAVMPVLPTRSENAWNAFLHTQWEN